MRVLLATYRDHPRSGGSLRVGQVLGKGLRRLGQDVEICFAYGSPGPVEADRGVPCHYLNLRSSRDVLSWSRFRRLIRRHRPDIVHFMEPIYWMQGASMHLPFKRVIHVHGAFREPLSRLNRLGWQLLRRRADLFVCISEGARESLMQLNAARPDQTDVVYNAIDVDWFQQRPDRQSARALLRLPQGARIVGIVCRLVDRKGCDDLLNVLRALGRDWHAVVVGDGPDRARLEVIAKAFDVRDRVHFTGDLGDVRPAYAAMDAYAFMSLNEAFGLSVAEAMACRVPIFGLGGMGEYREPAYPLVTPANACFVERVGRHEPRQQEDTTVLLQLAGRIADFARNQSAYDAMIDAAWHHVRDRFSMDVQASRMLQVYSRLVPSSQS
ncbi:MAG: glycosyltransferase [Acidobacteria bacterium]|nr:glycosyltransferase [Acidobacteriota bacterium]